MSAANNPETAPPNPANAPPRPPAAAPRPTLPTGIRLSATLDATDGSLGPLADLVGTWFGSQGWNLISVPTTLPNGQETFRLLIAPYAETITFTPVGALVPNRGGPAGDMFVPALQYTAVVSDLVTNQPLHVENGMWLLLTDPETGAQTVARLTSVPHGDSLLAVGAFGTVPGGPSIQPRSAMPVGTDGAPLGYTDPYLNLPSTVPFKATNVNQPLTDFLASQKDQPVVSNVFLDVSTATGGGITNIPFVVKNANATKVQSTFWIETVQDGTTGQQFLQLQYTQQVDLEFIPRPSDPQQRIMWPHTSVNTLKKQ